MRSTMKKLSAALLLAIAAFNVAASAQSVKGYAILKVTNEYQDTDTVGGLANCKGLSASLVPGDVIAMIECSTLADLNKAMISDIPALEGVSSVDVLRIWNE